MGTPAHAAVLDVVKRGTKPERLLVSGLLLIIVLLLLRQVFANHLSSDFAYIWTAGKMWALGIDPYGVSYRVFGASALANEAVPAPRGTWVYPPQWIAIALPFGLLPFQTAAWVWRILTAATLCLAIVIAWRASDELDAPPPFWVKALAALAIISGNGAAKLFDNGQTNGLILLGISLVMIGRPRKDLFLCTAGLLLVLLKPQIGIPFSAVALCDRSLRVPTLVAFMLTGLLCLPAFWSIGFDNTLGSLMSLQANLTSYAASVFNDPRTLSGVVSIVAYTRFATLPATVYAFAAAVACLSLLWTTQPRTVRETLFFPALLGCEYLFMPLHLNDLLAYPLILLFCVRWRTSSKVALALGLAILYRPQNLTSIILNGVSDRMFEAQIVLAGIVLITIALLIEWWRSKPLSPARLLHDTHHPGPSREAFRTDAA
jgi:hypothetical protein